MHRCKKAPKRKFWCSNAHVKAMPYIGNFAHLDLRNRKKSELVYRLVISIIIYASYGIVVKTLERGQLCHFSEREVI